MLLGLMPYRRMCSKGNLPPYHHRRLLLLLRFVMLLLFYATNIISATSSSCCQAFRGGRSAFATSLDHNTHSQRRTELTMRYRKTLTQLKSTTSTHHTTTTSPHPLQNQDTPNSKQQQQQQTTNNRQLFDYNNDPTILNLLQSRINDLTSHPAVVWDESSTFASMQKKKLSRRHLHLFDRRTNNNATVIIEDEHDDVDGSSSSHNNNNNSNNHRSTVIYQDDLFDRFAKAVCNAGVVARKEVFETWASALYIHYTFLTMGNINAPDGGSSDKRKPTRRIVDVAAGHGLLAWALLLLCDEEECNNNNNNNNNNNASIVEQQPPPLTVFCLDVQMPPSAELIHASMIQQWPHLQDRFDYVEARLEQLVPHPSCLLASVHACGILSDVLVATAAEYQMPLALVPCCHSRKRTLLEGVASPFAKREYEQIWNAKERYLPNLADLLDEARMTALENAGCDVREVFIPEIFTGKNRLIMGRPPSSVSSSDNMLVPKSDDDNALTPSTEITERSPPFRKGRMPPLLLDDDGGTTSTSSSSTTATTAAINPKARFMKGFYVPCEDTNESRDIVSSIAGRAAANKRKELMHNRNHVSAPQMDLSLWLPPEEDTEEKMEDDDDDGGGTLLLTEESLIRILERTSPEYVTCDVTKLGDVYINPAGRKSQSFRIQYNQVDGGTLSFDEAKLLHAQLRDAVPIQFPGAECR